jgi:hypothetical protein
MATTPGQGTPQKGLGLISAQLIGWAAGVIGIPASVAYAQLNMESGGRDVTSPAGAQGPWQFMPGTWSGLGCPGSVHNANDSTKCYAKFMYQLVQQYHGSVRDALAAYNAGPGNIGQGYGYADSILSAAGQPQSLKAGTGSGSTDPGTSGAPGTTPAPSTAPSSDGQSAQAGPDCLWAIGGQHISLLFGHGPSLPSACLVNKREARAVVGAALLVLGALAALPGIVIIVAYGFSQTKTGQAVTQAAEAVPGYGKAAAAVKGGTAAGGVRGGRGTPKPERHTRVGRRLSASEIAQANRNRRRLARMKQPPKPKPQGQPRKKAGP